jgi:hypothetical protein
MCAPGKFEYHKKKPLSIELTGHDAGSAPEKDGDWAAHKGSGQEFPEFFTPPFQVICRTVAK